MMHFRPITQKGTLWELRKVLTLVSLRSPRRLTTVEIFCYWQIFCVLSDNSTLLNYHFEIIESYRPVLSSLPFSLFCLGVPIRSLFCVMGHIYAYRDETIIMANKSFTTQDRVQTTRRK